MSRVLMTSWRNKRHYPDLCSSLIHNFLSRNVSDRMIGTLTQGQIYLKNDAFFFVLQVLRFFNKIQINSCN